METLTVLLVLIILALLCLLVEEHRDKDYWQHQCEYYQDNYHRVIAEQLEQLKLLRHLDHGEEANQTDARGSVHVRGR